MIAKRNEGVTVDAGTFDLHIWLPEGGQGPGLLLIQEIFGVGPYIQAVAQRLAAAGYVVAAPDVFWRFHPGWVAEHDEAGVTASMAKASQLDPELAVADCKAALEHLGSLAEVQGRPGVIGFCMGGSLAFGVAAAGDPHCCVSYYGSTVPQMADLVPAITCPTLLVFGDEDPFIPLDGIKALRSSLAEVDRITFHVENAGHAFDNHEAAIFYNESAAKTAWEKTSAFLSEHLPVGRENAS